MESAGTSKARPILPFILVLFFILGVLYIYYTPLWTPPDEERHFAYCQFIARHHELPRFTPEFDKTGVYMAFHPPLYYLTGSLLCSADSPPIEEEISVNPLPGPTTLLHPQEDIATFSKNVRSAYLLRLLSLLLGSITIYCIYKSSLIIFHGNQGIASFAALFVAMNPEFMHISASISNENLSTACATAFMYCLLRYLCKGPSTGCAVLLGLLLGSSLLTKISGFFLVPLTLCFFAYVLLKSTENAGKHVLLIFTLSAGIGAWWYLHNWILYDDPFFSKTMALAHPWSMRHALPSLADIKTIVEKSFISYFGYFGGQKVPLGWPHLVPYGALMLLGTAGLVRSVVKPGIRKNDLPLLLVLVFALLGGFAIFVLFNIKYLGAYQGRYLFVVILPITILTCMGLHTIVPKRCWTMFMSYSMIGLVVLNASALFFVLRPGYTAPRIKTAAQQEVFDSASPDITDDLSIGQSFVSPSDNLCGIEIIFSTTTISPSGTLLFTLFDHENGGTILYTINFPSEDILDFSKYYFVFPPIQDSRGRRYSFRISSEHERSGHNAIGVWYYKQDAYTEGTLLVNEKPVAGDMYFKAYSFSGDTPSSVLEGRKPHALNQGLYLDIWELQLYQERSEKFRLQTHTHEKLLRFQDAIEKRRH